MYFSALRSTLFSHAEGVKRQEQVIPYGHILTNKNKIRAKLTVTPDPNYILKGDNTHKEQTVCLPQLAKWTKKKI
jgi:hypothetical protein